MEKIYTGGQESYMIWISWSEHIVSFHEVANDDYEPLLFSDQHEKWSLCLKSAPVVFEFSKIYSKNNSGGRNNTQTLPTALYIGHVLYSIFSGRSPLLMNRACTQSSF